MHNKKTMIRIHYCWFGRGQKSQKIEKCISSWKKTYPEAEIIEWNEDNFDIECNEYVKEAYICKKYAFVSDYARLKIVYENGGLYLDTDVELLKRHTDDMLKNGFLGLENGKVNTGIGFCAKKGEKIIKEMMNDYEQIHFVLPDKSFDTTTCVRRNTQKLKKLGYRIKAFEKIDNLTLYPDEFFNPFDYNTGITKITENTYSIHHCEASWQTPKRLEYMTTKHRLIKEKGVLLGKLLYYLYRIKDKARRG